MLKSYPFCLSVCGLLLSFSLGAVPAFAQSSESAPYINTWLVNGTFDNASDNAGYEHDWIDEATVAPREGDVSGGMPWRYFDDRLFSRNYDDYQDLFSYFRVKRQECIRARVAYAHVYVHSVAEQQRAAHLRVGADNEFKVWINGVLVGAVTESRPYRDMEDISTALEPGWNRLLIKVANQEAGRFGFYARLTDENGTALPGLTYSTNGPADSLRVSTKPMNDIETGLLPTAFREWPYVGASVLDMKTSPPEQTFWLRKPEIALNASDFVLTAEGGTPPYRWTITKEDLPKGLRLREDGTLEGTIAKNAALRGYPFEACVTDARGSTARQTLSIDVRERPNRWVEEARLTALIHHPECLRAHANTESGIFDEFAQLMKRQGYGLGMVISYNNGEFAYRYPSLYEPDNPNGILLGRYKTALEKAGVRFGMYMGNLNGPNHGGDNGAILMVEDAIQRYHPAAFWFDWAGWDGISLDALYSMIKTYDPETVVILNGIPTMGNGDWDIICLEGWGAWGPLEKHWGLMPFDFAWPKQNAIESWRLVADPAFDYSKDFQPVWEEYVRLQVSLIGQGRIANIDHSATLRSGLDENGCLRSLDDSPLMVAHKRMADWANPAGLPPLYESYTQVDPGPLTPGSWGYDTINIPRDTLYLHMLTNPYGKSGFPTESKVTVGPVAMPIKGITCMNTGAALPFTQEQDAVRIDLAGIQPDPVDTIIKVTLGGVYPDVPAPTETLEGPIPAGNLAWGKPAQLLSRDCTHPLVASGFHFGFYAVDGIPFTFACGGNEWAWTLHVDLEAAHNVERVVLHFGDGYPTEYKVHLSADGENWQTVFHGAGSPKARFEHSFEPVSARYVRVECVKPDGPEQEGIQMHVEEIEVYASKQG